MKGHGYMIEFAVAIVTILGGLYFHTSLEKK